jgi:hypothetical protein
LRCSHEDLVEFIRSLQPGERVIEMGVSCLQGRRGTVYVSQNEGPTFGDKCVRWDKLPGEEGQMGTSVTGGTRRLDPQVDDQDYENTIPNKG